jgi:hypothetical protein
MTRLIAYFFGPTLDKDGRPRPIRRIDTILGAAFIFSAILTIAYWAQRNSPMDSGDWHRIGMAGGISTLILLLSRYRWVYVGTATAFIGMRLIVGSLFLPSFEAHRAKYFVFGLACLIPTWLVVRASVKQSR